MTADAGRLKRGTDLISRACVRGPPVFGHARPLHFWRNYSRYVIRMMLAFQWDSPGSGGHDDLVLRLGDWSHRCDSYYFALDENIAGEGRTHVIAVMRALLDQWKAHASSLADGAAVFMPFDFSDQCTAWLRISREGTQVSIRAGWSDLEGYSFFPSDYSAVQPTDWRSIDGSPRLVMTIDDFVRAVDASALALS